MELVLLFFQLWVISFIYLTLGLNSPSGPGFNSKQSCVLMKHIIMYCLLLGVQNVNKLQYNLF